MVAQINKTQEERLTKAIASIQERDGYCLVDSETEDMPHIVTYNENFYATYCTCKGHSEYGMDCYHGVAVDRHFDSRRPDFYTMHGIARLAKQVATPAPVETVPVVEVMAQANEAMVQFDRDADPNAYDVLAETKRTAAQREVAEENRKAEVRYMFNDL